MSDNLIILEERPFVKKFSFSNEYFCCITDEIDKYSVGFKTFSKLHPGEKNIMRSYMIDPSSRLFGPTYIGIRVPGATIGYVDVTNTIEGYHINIIHFYDNLRIEYLEGDYLSLKHKFNGKFIVYPNFTKPVK